MLLLWIGLSVWLAWAVFAVRLTSKIFRKLEYLNKFDPNKMSGVLCGSRYDQSCLNKYEIYFGSAVLIPLRVLLIVPIFGLGYVIIKICSIIYEVNPKRFYRPQGSLYFAISYYMPASFSRIIFFIMGMYSMPTKIFRLNDFWANYKPVQDVSNPPLIISNHVSYLDMWMLLHLQENPGFLAKMSIRSLPIVGMMAMFHQCIFINRDDPVERERITQSIVERVKLVEEGKMKPLLIFPEGTTTNGRALMKFKKGAFFTEKPFFVYSMMYSKDPSFIPCFNLINPAYSAFIFISKLHNQLDYYKFDQPIDPLWILQKHGRSPGQEDNWEIIAEEVKQLMCFAFKFDNDTSSFQEKKSFDIQMQGLTENEFRKRGE